MDRLIRRDFLQGETYSPVGFCCTRIPVMMLLEESDGYKMGPPGKTEINAQSTYLYS